jgi:hypothetical protein
VLRAGNLFWCLPLHCSGILGNLCKATGLKTSGDEATNRRVDWKTILSYLPSFAALVCFREAVHVGSRKKNKLIRKDGIEPSECYHAVDS